MSSNREKLSAEKLVGIGLLTALVFGAQLIRSANKSPAKRAKEAADRQDRHLAQRAYEKNWREAWELDQSRWKAFEADPAASAAFKAEYFIPVPIGCSTGTVTQSHGGSLWDTWDEYVVTDGDNRLSLKCRHDGRYLILALETSSGFYRNEGSYDEKTLFIGKCDGTPTAEQRKVAALIGVLQANGLLQQRSPVVVFKDYWQMRYAHYAKFAAARGWPTAKDGEAKRVSSEYYGPRRAS